jgi:hypothetical protein
MAQDHGFDINKGGWMPESKGGYFSPYENPNLVDGPRRKLEMRLARETVNLLKKTRQCFLCLSVVLCGSRAHSNHAEKWRNTVIRLKTWNC